MNKNRVIKVCKDYYRSMRSHGEPPDQFTTSDFEIVDNVCELIRDKYRNVLPDNMDKSEKKILNVFTPDLLIFAKY